MQVSLLQLRGGLQGAAHECIAVVALFCKRWLSSDAMVAHGGVQC